MNRINVGCGPNPTAGWVNFDNSPSVRLAKSRKLAAVLRRLGIIDDGQLSVIQAAQMNEIQWADATRRIPLPDASVAILYSAHMVEHLDRRGAAAFLREARRVLMPNGIIRIVVPDLQKLVTEYMAQGDANAFVERSLLFHPKPRTLLDKLKYLVIGDRHHQWMYDGQSMVKLLTAADFEQPSILPPGATLIPDPGSLDLCERAEESVYVEAYRR